MRPGNCHDLMSSSRQDHSDQLSQTRFVFHDQNGRRESRLVGHHRGFGRLLGCSRQVDRERGPATGRPIDLHPAASLLDDGIDFRECHRGRADVLAGEKRLEAPRPALRRDPVGSVRDDEPDPRR